jgi:hypothetical protein
MLRNAGREAVKKMGLAPSTHRECKRKLVGREVPVPFFSQPRIVSKMARLDK